MTTFPSNHKLKKPIVIGILGGVASGKSAVTAILNRNGAEVISADEIAHAVLRQPDTIEAIVQEFGLEVLAEPNELNRNKRTIDRKKLGSKVFGVDTTTRRRALEAIVHPRIRQIAKEKLNALIAERKSRWIVLDAPLLIEGGWRPFCDRILFVDTPDSLRRRFAAERGWDEFEWKKREQAQLSLDEKRLAATDILMNDQGLDSLEQRVIALIQSWDKDPPD